MKKKRIIILMLAILVPLMAVGYAALQQRLIISGTSHVDSNWQVEIINITESDIVGDATDKVAPSYTATTARFRVSLINPTDSITYNIKIKNLGTLDARIKKINVDTGSSDAIEYEVKCKIDNGEYQVCNETNFKNQVLEPNKEQMVKIKVSFKEGYIGQPSQENSTSTVKVVIDYVQNFKDSSGQQIIPYKDYSIGDKITYKDTDWYVIEDSPASQDYVVLLKENVLTNTELGTYAYRSGYDTTQFSINSSNLYDVSKVKQAVESYAVEKGIMIDLIEINGYKIRLITKDELQNNLGWSITWRGPEENGVPNWVYQDFGENQNNVYGYWTMTPSENYSSFVWRVHSDKTLNTDVVSTNTRGVRPVINLLKSAIE